MTTTAKTELVNAAMAHLGEPPFETISPDVPDAALVKVLAQLDGPSGAERYCLARHPWLCALSYATLAPSVGISANWKWTNHFLLPTTAVKLWDVEGLSGGTDTAYEAGTETVSATLRQVIRSNEAGLYVAYTEAKGFEAYSAELSNYMAFVLAARTSGPLKSDYEGAERLMRSAREYLAEAMGGEAGQHGGEDPRVRHSLAELRASAR